MRLKNVPGAREEMLVNPFVIQEPEGKKGNWNEVFGNGHPLHIEIGMGKGQFITELAQRNPDVNYIGIEKYSSVLIRGLEKREKIECDNLYFLRFDAEYITGIFAKDEVERIYLNFSDPWPKDRHARRRLTSQEYLDRYSQFLKPEGTLEFKTDNQALFAFSLEQIELAGWKLLACTYDLHRDEALNGGNILTEYEARFSARGQSICKLIAKRA